MNKQVEKKHYDFNRYSYVGRWASYYYQLCEVISLKPNSILEIGVGDQVFCSYIKNNTNILYKNLDIAEDLGPDIVASVTDIPLDSKSFDVVCAFEVLEHIPFELLDTALGEMSRVSKKYVLVSLPHFGPAFLFMLKVPLMPLIRFAKKLYFPNINCLILRLLWLNSKKTFLWM